MRAGLVKGQKLTTTAMTCDRRIDRNDMYSTFKLTDMTMHYLLVNRSLVGSWLEPRLQAVRRSPLEKWKEVITTAPVVFTCVLAISRWA